MSKEPIFVEDGDTLVIIAKTPITLSDPADEFPFLSQAFRVVADRPGGALALVPLAASPTRVYQSEVDQYEARKYSEFVEAGILKDGAL